MLRRWKEKDRKSQLLPLASSSWKARCLLVEGTLEHLEKGKVVVLDEERKAAMVSNLLVVLCSDSNATPVVNAGSLNN